MTVLTPRQQQTLSLLLTGYRAKDIARNLDLAVSTVKIHIRTVQSKAGSTRIPDLVRLAAAEGILTPDHPLSRAFRGEA